jgi:NADPH-dependent 2,4-dienoyl-CoA reductase/sulfur reductase-like enzyme/rhodanese-related sulfurtransferase
MSYRVVIVGAVALGPKVACRLRRLRPDAEIVMVDQDRFISYGGCGIPYYLSEDVPDERSLMSTSFHVLRDEKFFREAKGVTVRPRTRALRIDREKKTVEIEDLESGEISGLPYDRLVLGTGSLPIRPPIPGIDLENVFCVSNLQNALDIKKTLVQPDVERAVVVGAGAIGVEVTEALADIWGMKTALVERLGHIFPRLFDANMASMGEQHLAEKGVEVLTGETVLRVEGEEGEEGDGRVRRVVTNQRTLAADIVILAAGVRPNSSLAKEAGLELSEQGGIVVNEFLQTSDPDIYAGGDCVENRSLVTGGPVFTPLGSLANRHGRVIAARLAGKEERFPGVVGSFIVKVFDLCLAAAGLSQEEAIANRFDAERVLTVGYDRAHFMPEKALMFLQLVVDRADRRVLGIQGVGKANDAVAVRVDAVAALLKHHPTVEDISNLEIAYSPPFASAMDSLNALGNTAANLLDGLYRRMTVGEAMEHLHGGDEEVLFLDLNAPRQAKPYLLQFPGQWMNIPYENLASRIDEVPRDRTIVTICDSGIRSYESQVLLSARGFPSVFAMEGGLNLLRKLGLDVTPSP